MSILGLATLLLMATTSQVKATRDSLLWLARQCQAPRIRSMREFAEQELVIPDGPYAGRRFSIDRQPYTGLLFDAIDSGHWNRFAITGPTQSGKTFSGSITPVLYHLFEIGETVIFGLPDQDMAGDKWREDIRPAIERTRYRELLPRAGGGSRGGKVRAIKFRNGATLRFMSGGGGDKSRAGFTARVLVVTEVDGMDEAGGGSREADKITQLEGRTRAYGDRKRVYLECTVSIEEGRIWRELKGGTDSKIALPCPHCRQWVSPEREHLSGWQQAEHEMAARGEAHFVCPSCRVPWSEQERRQANLAGVLVHRGQEVTPEGQAVGPLPPTRTLGFRWSAVNNLFLGAADIAADEWKASRSIDEENAEKELRQFVWCLPYQPPSEDSTKLEAFGICARTSKSPRGQLPDGTEALTVQVDLGKWLAHWVAIAWSADGRSLIVDYDRFEIPSASLPLEQAILAALRTFRDERVMPGWTAADGHRYVPDQTWIDAGYQPAAVYAFCRDKDTDQDLFRPTIGRGSNHRQLRYSKPKSTTNQVKFVGLEYHVVWNEAEGLFVVEVNADFWKGFLHRRLAVPVDAPGAMLLHAAMPREHLTLAKHFTAEKEVEQYIEGKGTIRVWETIRKANHYLDCGYGACAAAHMAGVEFVDARPPDPEPPPPAGKPLTTSDGRPFLVTQR